MIENYTRLSSRMFTATVVGKDKNGRKITEGRETYKTPSGVYEIKDWARLVEKAAEADGLLPLLEQIKRHVKEYAWMKNASDINVLILAAECLTGRAYEHWEGFVIPMNTQADEMSGSSREGPLPSHILQEVIHGIIKKPILKRSEQPCGSGFC